MSPLNISAVQAAGDALVAKVADLGAAGRALTVQNATYREGYERITALYDQVHATRTDLENQARNIKPDGAAANIEGIIEGAGMVHDAVAGEGGGSLRNSLLSVENELAKLLNSMRESYVTYFGTDQDSAANHAGAAKTL